MIPPFVRISAAMLPSELTPYVTRDFSSPRSQQKIQEIADSLPHKGYDPSLADLPIHVVRTGEGYVIADGNHRLKAMERANYDRPIQVKVSSVPSFVRTAGFAPMEMPDPPEDRNVVDWDNIRRHHLFQAYMQIPEDILNNRPATPHPLYQDETFGFDNPLYPAMARQVAVNELGQFSPWVEFGGSRDIRKAGWGLLGKKTPKSGQFPDPHINIQDRHNMPYSPFITAKSAYNLMRGVHLSDPMSAPRYRGIYEPQAAQNFLSRVKPGYTFDMPLASFTEDPDVAKGYGTSYRFRLAPGARGVVGEENINYSGLAPAYETVTGGRFKVHSVEPGDTTTINLQQVGTYDPDDLITKLNKQPKVASDQHVDISDLDDDLFDGPPYVRQDNDFYVEDEPLAEVIDIFQKSPKGRTSSAPSFVRVAAAPATATPNFVRTAVTMVPDDSQEPLKYEPGKYFYRAHPMVRPFKVDKATSAPLEGYGEDEEDAALGNIDRQTGFSGFDNPYDLARYLHEFGWDEDEDFDLRNPHKWQVMAYPGRAVGEGFDKEPLSLPDSRAQREQMSYTTFLNRLRSTPRPETARHWTTFQIDKDGMPRNTLRSGWQPGNGSDMDWLHEHNKYLTYGFGEDPYEYRPEKILPLPMEMRRKAAAPNWLEQASAIASSKPWTMYEHARNVRRAAWLLTHGKEPEPQTFPDPHARFMSEKFPISPEQHEQARTILRGLREAPQHDFELWRGIGGIEDPERFLSGAQEGAEVDLPLASFSPYADMADWYGNDVMYKVSPGHRSIPGVLLDEGDKSDTNREYVSGGRFRVDHVERFPDRSGPQGQYANVHLTQVGTSDPDRDRTASAATIPDFVRKV